MEPRLLAGGCRFLKGQGSVCAGRGKGSQSQTFRWGFLTFSKKTDLRQLVRLCYHAEGAVCHVTMLNHLMSAWEKPCVVIAGGRESAGWEAYNETSYLDTIGALPCCKSGGCWKSKIKDCLWMEGEYIRDV